MYSAGIGIYAALKKYNVVSFTMTYSAKNHNEPYINIDSVNSTKMVFDVDARLSYRGLTYNTVDMPMIKNRQYIPADGQYYKNYYFERGTSMSDDGADGGIADFYANWNFGAMQFNGTSMASCFRKTPFIHSFIQPTGKYTIIMWFKVGNNFSADANGGSLFDSGTNGDSYGIRIGSIGHPTNPDMNTLAFKIFTSSKIFDIQDTTGMTLGTNKLYGAAFSIDNSGSVNSFIRMWKQNEYPIFNLGSITFPEIDSPMFARLGANGNASSGLVPNGTTIYSIRAYNTNLSASDATQEMLQHAPQFYSLYQLDCAINPAVLTDLSPYQLVTEVRNTALEAAPVELEATTSLPLGAGKDIRIDMGLTGATLNLNDYTIQMVFSLASSGRAILFSNHDGSFEIKYQSSSGQLEIQHQNGIATFPITLSANTKYVLSITYQHSYFFVHVNGVPVTGTVAINRPQTLQLPASPYAYIGSSTVNTSPATFNLKSFIILPYAKFSGSPYNPNLHEYDVNQLDFLFSSYPFGMTRYLKLDNFTFTGSNIFELVSIELLSFTLKNVAQYSALYSTTSPDNPFDFNVLQDTYPHHKVDGVFNNAKAFVRQTASSSTQLIYDFGLPRDHLQALAYIRLAASYANYPTGFRVSSSPDGINWSVATTFSNLENPGNQWNQIALGPLLELP